MAALGTVVPVAERPLSRLLGLAHLERERVGAGLLLLRCSAVHTFGMRFPLDLFFLDRHGRVLRVERSVGRRRFVACRGAAAVLERPSEPARRCRGGGHGADGVHEDVHG